ncbi:hypothetical protein GWK47_005164 [Chionoecetes opilio]|uniref:Uncharacterized protein n=1 Tax=Chionoecetes opilio TaxID=41210 RepID=A0A8J4YAI3_CHIOP|nr:hypothetical protein GWK47_005164 [Chionoecetes opilio]
MTQQPLPQPPTYEVAMLGQPYVIAPIVPYPYYEYSLQHYVQTQVVRMPPRTRFLDTNNDRKHGLNFWPWCLNEKDVVYSFLGLVRVMAEIEVLGELSQLKAQVQVLTEARRGQDDVVASFKIENAELRQLLGNRGVPTTPVPLEERSLEGSEE